MAMSDFAEQRLGKRFTAFRSDLGVPTEKARSSALHYGVLSCWRTARPLRLREDGLRFAMNIRLYGTRSPTYPVVGPTLG
jgi:hypothetical protein